MQTLGGELCAPEGPSDLAGLLFVPAAGVTFDTEGLGRRHRPRATRDLSFLHPRTRESSMPRPMWKGYLKLSLVSCSVALYNASSTSERVSFNTLNRKT